MVSSNLLPAFTDQKCKIGIEPYVVNDNMGYLSWTTMEVFTNTTHSPNRNKNHDPHTLFHDKWIKSGIKLSAILNILSNRKPYVNPRTPVSRNSNISSSNVIVKEFMNNINECINTLGRNNVSSHSKLYLNIAVHGPRWEILPVLLTVLNESKYRHSGLFSRLVINIITGHDHSEKSPNNKKPPYCLKNFGAKNGFGQNSVINILVPGPFGDAGIGAYLNDNQDNFYVKVN